MYEIHILEWMHKILPVGIQYKPVQWSLNYFTRSLPNCDDSVLVVFLIISISYILFAYLIFYS